MNNSSLFNNPQAEQALAAMSPNTRRSYKEKGEAMYNTISFETSTLLHPNSPDDFNAIIRVLKSGLSPSDLDDDERATLKRHYGDGWETSVLNEINR